MSTVTSKDGTRIAYEKTGAGTALILVDGALGYRANMGLLPLAARLADHFTVYTYDRRGRGESGDALQERAPQDFVAADVVAREVEDLEALIDAAGEPAFLYGISSGAALVMEAALRLGDKVRKLAMYEAPYNSDADAQQAWREYVGRLGALLAADRRGDAVALFMKLVGATDEDIAPVRQMPMWPLFEAIAPTLAYDHTALLGEDAAVPVERAARVPVPALVMNGSASYPFMQETARALAQAMPLAQHRVLEGQTHEVAEEALAPLLVEFFRSEVPSNGKSRTTGKANR